METSFYEGRALASTRRIVVGFANAVERQWDGPLPSFTKLRRNPVQGTLCRLATTTAISSSKTFTFTGIQPSKTAIIRKTQESERIGKRSSHSHLIGISYYSQVSNAIRTQSEHKANFPFRTAIMELIRRRRLPPTSHHRHHEHQQWQVEKEKKEKRKGEGDVR